ncbi:MAG: tetratricopeptide repeat protein [Planctomycetota bacterium]
MNGRAARAFSAALLLLCCGVCSSWIAADEPVPPVLAGGDEVELAAPLLGRPQILTGVISELAGESVLLRTRGVLRPVPLRDVRQLRFTHPAGYAEGLRQIQAGDWRDAIVSLTSALALESRPWVLREIRAELAACRRSLGEWEAGIREVEEILATDPDSRHVLQLPLVWDERLPADKRYPGKLEELQEPSASRRLTAATALLIGTPHSDMAAAALLDLRRNGRGGLVRMAELQLWRVTIARRETLRVSDVERLQERIGEFSRAMRGPGEFLCGRAWRQLGDADRAAACLLWMPLAAPLDPATCTAALREAAEVLEESGRPEAARRILRSCP